MSSPVRFTIGATEIIILIDSCGVIPFPANRIFPSVSDQEWVGMRNRYPSAFADGNQLVARVACYVLRQGDRLVLVDTGMGPANGEAVPGFQGKLLEELATEGISVEQVDTVVLTHLDPDHSGGCVRLSIGSGKNPTFPSAQYVVHRNDWNLCEEQRTSTAPRRFVPEHIFPIADANALAIVDGETAIGPGMKMIPTPGHTSGHMSVWVEGNGNSLLIAGDAFYHPLQVHSPDHAFPLDMDATTARHTRLALLNRLQGMDALLASCHFPTPGVGRIEHGQGERYWVPIDFEASSNDSGR